MMTTMFSTMMMPTWMIKGGVVGFLSLGDA